jgi:hypothetical protein
LTELTVADSGKNIPLDPTFSSWADAMEVDRQRSVIPEKEVAVPELPLAEVSGEQVVRPVPQYNVPYCYSVDGFQRLPFRHQKEFAFRCRKTLETDAFGEAQPLSEEVKESLRMQIDEFDKERRRRASEAREAPP